MSHNFIVAIALLSACIILVVDVEASSLNPRKRKSREYDLPGPMIPGEVQPALPSRPMTLAEVLAVVDKMENEIPAPDAGFENRRDHIENALNLLQTFQRNNPGDRLNLNLQKAFDRVNFDKFTLMQQHGWK